VTGRSADPAEVGHCIKWYQSKRIFLADNRQKGEETKELEVVLCV
jgi:hypothetical protein